MTFANITPEAQEDGILYADAVPVTPTEANLGDGAAIPTQIPTTFGEAILAVVKLSINGLIVSNSTYVVMQINVGGDTWVDINWCYWSGTQGTATFVFSNGIAGANSFQQTRQSGQVPVNSSGVQGNGSNQVTLGGRIRFVGKTVMAGGSSSISGVPTQVSATIRYRLQPLR